MEYVWDPSDFTPEEIADKVEEISSLCIDYGNSSFEITQEAIDTMFSLIKGFEALSDQSRELFTTVLLEKTAYLMDFIFQKTQKGKEAIAQTNFDPEFKNAVRIFFYFFCCGTAHIETVCGRAPTVMDTANKKAAKGKKTKAAAASYNDENDDFAWASVRIIFLQAMKRLLTVPSTLLWSMGIVQENFLVAAWGYAVKLLEERPMGIVGTGAAEGAARAICKDIVISCVECFGNANVSGSFTNLTSALLEGINRAEHMSVFSAEICGRSPALLTGEFLKEISVMEFSSQSAAAGMKNVGAFVENLVKFNSQIMIANLPVILRQLDAGAHQIRSSLISALGQIVLKVDEQIKNDNIMDTPEEKKLPQNEDADADAEEAAEEKGTTENQKAMLPRVRDNILDMIVERTHDISPYTRATVLKVWHVLVSGDAVPVRRFASIAELAYDRLHDKAAAVRKAAISLLTVVMDRNPYGSSLDHLAFMQQKLLLESKLTARFELMKAAYDIAQASINKENKAKDQEDQEEQMKEATVDAKAVPDDAVAEDTAEMQVADGEVQAESNGDVKEEKEGEEEEEDDDDMGMDAFQLMPEIQDDAEVQILKKGIAYCESGLDMIKILVQAAPKINGMLKSKSSLEVIEGLKFIARTVNFNIRGSLKNFKCSLPLVFHTETSIRDACINCFRNVFLVSGDSESDAANVLPPSEVARSLCQLLQTFGASEKTCVEKILKELFSNGEMDANIAVELWKIITESKADTSDAFNASHKKASDVGVALSILTIISRSLDDSNTSDAKFSLAVKHGLSQDVFSTLDFSAMKAAAMFLQECRPFRAQDVVSASDTTTEKRKLFDTATKKLVGVILGGMCEESDEFTRAWFPACEEAIHAMFHFHPSADLVLGTILSSMYASFAISRTSAEDAASAPTPVICSSARLSRFMFVLGQVSMNSLVFADRLSQQAKKFVVQNAKEENAKQRIALGDDQQAAEDDADMTAAIDADCDNCFHFTTEKSLVMANILGEFHPIIALVVANQSNKFSNQLLRETSILALCKYMCVSSVICEKYLPLLFTALENETVEACRTTIMLAFGDLMLRFPNSMEAWTPLMYARLSDDKVVVRYNALMVLTHLILNDMVKVKGQVAHVVMCLTDSEPKIKDMAHTFFIKLSERSNNPVYNLLGDIIGVISRETQSKGEGVVEVASLSADALNYPKRELNAREFQATMHFLLSFVKKDKQADSMLERLVVRLSVAQSLRQRRSLAFCISELSVTEKGVKKMAEMIRSIKDALYDEEVFEYVLKTVQSAKKDSAKGSADEKKIVDELEQTLMAINRDAHGEEMVEGSQENALGENTAPKNAEKEKDEFSLRDPTKPAAKVAKGAKNPSKKAARKPKKKAVESESEDEEESDCDEVEMDETPVVAKSSRAGRGRKVLGEVN